MFKFYNYNDAENRLNINAYNKQYQNYRMNKSKPLRLQTAN